MTRLFDRVFRGVEILMAVLLTLMVSLMFLNVVLRFGFSAGFVWSEEVTRLAFIYLVYFGTIGAFRDNQHLGMDSLLERASPLVQKVLYALVQVIIIAVMWLLVQGSTDLAVQNMDARMVATQYPRALIFAAGIVTGVAIQLLAAVNLYRVLVKKVPVSELLRVQDDAAETVGGVRTSID
jgi:TRAP-type C4-dicarboxylate transport system permease small subunit